MRQLILIKNYRNQVISRLRKQAKDYDLHRSRLLAIVCNQENVRFWTIAVKVSRQVQMFWEKE